MANLPTVTSNIPRDLRVFLDRVREAMNSGTPDGVVTARQLVAAGIAQYSGGNLVGVVGAGVTPSRPKNVTASGALANIMVTWDKPVYEGHAFAEIWAAARTEAQEAADPKEDPTIGQAELVGMSPGTFFAHNIGAGGKRWYWVRFVNFAGTAGPYNATEGVFGETSVDPAYILEILTGEITASQLSNALSSRINLIDGSAEVTGSVNARVAELQGQVNELLNLPTWDTTTTYHTDDQVVYAGYLYVALADNTNVEPGTNPDVWDQVGEYATLGGAVAAHTTQIGELQTDLSQEVLDRTTLATQLRGDYTGDDISLISSGLIFEEQKARSEQDGALAQSISTLTAFSNTRSKVYYQSTAPTGTTVTPLVTGDLWIDTDVTYADGYVEGDYVIRSMRQYRWDGSQWAEAMDFGFADWFSAIRTEKTARVTEDEALSKRIDTYVAATDGSLALVNQTVIANTAKGEANATEIRTLTSTVTGNNSTLTSAIELEASTRTTALETVAQTINTLSSNVDGRIAAAVQTEASTRAAADGAISANYTVKMDIGNFAAGFGLIGTAYNAAPTFDFGVQANKFFIAPPVNTDANAPVQNLYPGFVWRQNGTGDVKYYTGSTWSTTPQNLPFVVQTTPTTVNGVSVPVGVYIEAAYIKNGTITNAKIANAAIDNAKIANLDAGKITTGYLDAGRIAAGSIDANMIDARGLSIQDANGKIILAAGTPLKIENIEGLGTLAAYSSLTLASITDAGDLAGKDSVTSSDLDANLAGLIDGKVESWFQSTDPSESWTSTALKSAHLGDLWWNTTTNKLSVYRVSDTTYSWEVITDKTATDAYQSAATAQDTADRKRQVFVSQPTTPYDVGDLWDRGSTTGIWRCNNARATGDYVAADWQVVADKTGSNTAASISNQGNFATLDKITKDNVSTYIDSVAIGFAYIANDIESSDYTAGSTGWKIDKSGAMEMNNATFRGTLDITGATGTNRLEITNNTIKVIDAAGVTRVKIGDLS